MNVGTPFEGWLTQLKDAAQRSPDAKSYLRHAIALLKIFRWVSGLSLAITWPTPDRIGHSANTLR